ncbi:hypothetical protein K432DRAFT_5346 [Lepidopterella palustris CBS 459.81]|uniref:Uncharacterized protein n=1 Tax=Lepidopterella palustris CBS 459.81 TaxID=1314670 RepID=A0A8E2EDK9_9PEZI|nr:hypothetical protein K432DRAFT_5346 [Lepidopterella palustris CBS 459.81]
MQGCQVSFPRVLPPFAYLAPTIDKPRDTPHSNLEAYKVTKQMSISFGLYTVAGMVEILCSRIMLVLLADSNLRQDLSHHQCDTPSSCWQQPSHQYRTVFTRISCTQSWILFNGKTKIISFAVESKMWFYGVSFVH